MPVVLERFIEDPITLNSYAVINAYETFLTALDILFKYSMLIPNIMMDCIGPKYHYIYFLSSSVLKFNGGCDNKKQLTKFR